MKKFLKWGGILLLAFFVFRLATGNKSETTSTEQTLSSTGNKANRDKALAAILKEPKIADAAITDANVLYAQVKDDGTSRKGYAMYLCEVLNEHKAEVERVKVVALGSQNSPDRDNAYGKLLGECWCKTYEAK